MGGLVSVLNVKALVGLLRDCTTSPINRFAALVLAPPPAQLRLAQVHIEAACAVVNLDRKYYANLENICNAFSSFTFNPRTPGFCPL